MIESSRRAFLGGLASLVVAPAIVKVGNIMPVKVMIPTPMLLEAKLKFFRPGLKNPIVLASASIAETDSVSSIAMRIMNLPNVFCRRRGGYFWEFSEKAIQAFDREVGEARGYSCNPYPEYAFRYLRGIPVLKDGELIFHDDRGESHDT